MPSTDLTDSSADKSTSAIGTPHSSHVNEEAVSEQADDLVKYLSAIINSKLPVAEQDIDPAHSPQLENIRVRTDRIPNRTFQALIDLMRVAESHQSNLETIQSQAVKDNKPLLNEIFINEEANLRTVGTTIIRRLHEDFYQHGDYVDICWDQLIIGMRNVYARTENIEHWRGRLNVVKDNIVPQISAINPLLAPAESVAKVAVNLTAYEVSQNLDKNLIDLGISDGALREDAQVLFKTKSKLEEYQRASDLAYAQWGISCKKVYEEKLGGGPSKANVITTLQQIRFADENLSQLISPIKEYLIKNNERYGNGITVIREVDSFCDVVPKIMKDIERIYAAKDIIEDSQKDKFVETVSDLGIFTFKYLESMKDHFDQREISPTTQKKFILEITRDFLLNTLHLIRTLYTMLDAESSSPNSKKAEKNRMAEDRFFSTLPRNNKTCRALAKPSDVRKIVEKVEKAINIIYALALASVTGQIMESIDQKEGSVKKAPVKLDTSNDSMIRFHQVLGEDVVAGSQRLERLLAKEKSEHKSVSFTRRIKTFFRISRHKC